jgi:hypothetical protein
MAKYIMLAFSNPVAGREEEYNLWYDAYHVPEMLQSPGMVAAQRFRVASIEPPDWPGYQPMPYRYLNLMEFETDDLQRFKQVLWSPENTGRIRKSDAFDSSKVICKIYEPFRPKVTKK